MNKIAELVKEAEVRGVLAALVDGGHLKVASQEEFDALTEVVSASIDGYDHDLNTVLSKTAEVIEYLENGDFEKEAGEAEIDETAVMAAFGELSMMKMAGQIDEEAFAKEANKLQALLDFGRKAVESTKGAAGRAFAGAKNVGKEIKDAAVAGQARRGHAAVGEAKRNISDLSKFDTKSGNAFEQALNKGFADKKIPYEQALAKGKRDRLIGVAKTTGLYGAGAAGTAVGGKALYDKYKK